MCDKSPCMINRALCNVCLGCWSPTYEPRPQLPKLKLSQQLESRKLVTHRIIFTVFFMSEDVIPIYLVQCPAILCLCALTADLLWIKCIHPLSNCAAVAPVAPLQKLTSRLRTYQVVFNKNVCLLSYLQRFPFSGLTNQNSSPPPPSENLVAAHLFA